MRINYFMNRLLLILILIPLIGFSQSTLDANAYNIRGISKKNLKDYSGAIDDYNKAIELNPNDANAYVNIGICKYYLNQNVCPDFKKACELNLCEMYNKFCK